jgi:FeS assembly SUF system protein
MKQEEKQRIIDDIRIMLKNVYDPEIPVNIWDLGLIYDVSVDDNGKAKVLMTLTAPNCPVAESLPAWVKQGMLDVKGVRDAEVEITFDPPWNQDMISEAAKLELGLL